MASDRQAPEAGVYTIAAIGAQVTAGAASARVAVPVTSNGTAARYVRILTTGLAYVRPGDSTVVATVNDVLCNSNFDLVLCVRGQTHIAYLQEAAAAKINITPLEI